MTESTEQADSEDRTETANAVRDRGGRFAPGNPGKRPGTRNKATRAIERMLEGEAEQLTRRLIQSAMEGDTAALRIVFDRIAPTYRPHGRPVRLPALELAKTPTERCDAIVEAVARGVLPPDVARQLLDGIAAAMRVAEIDEIEKRLAALESKS